MMEKTRLLDDGKSAEKFKAVSKVQQQYRQTTDI